MRNQTLLAPDKPFPVDQIELEILGYDFADEALELAATAVHEMRGRKSRQQQTLLLLLHCAVFCPGP